MMINDQPDGCQSGRPEGYGDFAWISQDLTAARRQKGYTKKSVTRRPGPALLQSWT
jgi:hypothetical protein